MRAAIHQPNFLPWLGLFHRIAHVDRFVFFDHVQALRGKSWLSRNRILIQGEAHWLTVPIVRSGRGLQAVDAVEIVQDGDFPAKHLRTLELVYGRHPHAQDGLHVVEAAFTSGHRRLAELNADFIIRVSRALGLGAEFVTSRSLCDAHPGLEQLRGNELVLATCRAAGADAYLSGDGCTDFIEPASFAAYGVDFAFQAYRHPVYAQRGSREFVSHLSVLDALCNLGFAGVRDLLVGAPVRLVAPA
jgi:hypothetical protein